jgi:two-component system, chemotaxis family, sensor kinase CheA
MADSRYADFVLESREHLQVFEKSILALEKATVGEVAELIDASFRVVHSLKGNSGFLGFHAVQKLAHATEEILANYREAKSTLPTQIVELLLLAIDRLSAMIDDLDHSEAHDVSSLLERLKSIEAHSTSAQPSADLSLHLPTPPASVLPMLQSIDATGAVRGFQIASIDFTTNVSEWPLPLRMDCKLLTAKSLFDVKRALVSANQDRTWSELGTVDLTGMSLSHLSAALESNTNSPADTIRAIELLYEPRAFSDGVPEAPILCWARKDARQASSESEPQRPSTPIEHSTGVKKLSVESYVPTPVTCAVVVPPTFVSPTAKPSSAREAIVVGKSLAPLVPSEKISSLRIQVDLLDRLMTLVGELTLVRNQSLLAFGEIDGTPRAIIQRLNSVTSELQEAVLKTRMQPVGNLFGRFPRMVRDLGRQLGKQVELVMIGQEVELDKTVLEQLSDPLTHLIRNSTDHGLEPPDLRQQAGKSAVGQITLSATAADGQVIIEIRDDGRGIDPNAVRSKLITLGIKTEAELQRISSKELYSSILLPGFSTAKQVSDVSGRGVGMDVVKTNIERLEGTLTIDSTPGRGTSIILRVPLTLAIIPCLIVTVGEERFAVPQRGLEEIVCLHPGGRGTIEHSYDEELYRLRDTLLPVVRLKEVLRRNSVFDAATKAQIMIDNAPKNRSPDCIEYMLVLRTNGRKFGLLVDDVRGTEEVVVKPMHPSLKKIGIFAGATLMGDGKVALIANIDGIAEHAECYGTEPPQSSGKKERDPAEVHRILLFEFGPKEQFALPLVQVRRIESISMDQVEHVGNQSFITIDGVATRIVHLDKYLNVSAGELTSNMHLLLPKFVAEPMGILVSRIVDTDTLAIELQEATVEDPGILGTAIVRGKLSLFIDTQFLREKLFGTQPSETVSYEGKRAKPIHASDRPTSLSANPVVNPHVLLVDDTPFFREVVKRYFERIGLTVTTAVDGIDGLHKLDLEPFDLVVSDIEMPNMNGWEFCMAARERGCLTPFLALTSLSKHENASKASECGFNQFEEKLDHDRLVGAVRSLLGIERGDAR